MIKKGILYGYVIDDLYYLYAGFFDKEVKDKENFIQLLKETGDYTDCWMKGKKINIFEEGERLHRGKLLIKEGITVTSFWGSGDGLKWKRKEILEEEKIIGEYQELIKEIENIEEEQDLKKKIKSKFNIEDERLDRFLNYYHFYDEPPMEEFNFLKKIEKTAQETGLTHLVVIPVFDEGGSFEEDIIRTLLEKVRKKESLYTKELYLNNDGNISREAIEKNLALLR